VFGFPGIVSLIVVVTRLLLQTLPERMLREAESAGTKPVYCMTIRVGTYETGQYSN
jgi:hypothetical protein